MSKIYIIAFKNPLRVTDTMEEERKRQVKAGGRFEILVSKEHVHALKFRADMMPTTFTHDDSLKAAMYHCHVIVTGVKIFESTLDSKHVIQYTYDGKYRIMQLQPILDQIFRTVTTVATRRRVFRDGADHQTGLYSPERDHTQRLWYIRTTHRD